jgi:hypothetical protein
MLHVPDHHNLVHHDSGCPLYWCNVQCDHDHLYLMISLDNIVHECLSCNSMLSAKSHAEVIFVLWVNMDGLFCTLKLRIHNLIKKAPNFL